MNEEIANRLLDYLSSISDSLVEIAVSLEVLEHNFSDCMSSDGKNYSISIVGDVCAN